MENCLCFRSLWHQSTCGMNASAVGATRDGGLLRAAVRPLRLCGPRQGQSGARAAGTDGVEMGMVWREPRRVSARMGDGHLVPVLGWGTSLPVPSPPGLKGQDGVTVPAPELGACAGLSGQGVGLGSLSRGDVWGLGPHPWIRAPMLSRVLSHPASWSGQLGPGSGMPGQGR